jgi:hypothetical protein
MQFTILDDMLHHGGLLVRLVGDQLCCPQAKRIAVNRQRPPLAASAAVWARREAPTGRLEQGGWPTAAHLAAAIREREFWSKV